MNKKKMLVSKNKNDMTYVLEQHGCSLLTEFCRNREALWLLLSRAARLSRPPWPGSLPSLTKSLHPLLGPIYCWGWLPADTVDVLGSYAAYKARRILKT